jgi:hypothetical protein
LHRLSIHLNGIPVGISLGSGGRRRDLERAGGGYVGGFITPAGEDSRNDQDWQCVEKKARTAHE